MISAERSSWARHEWQFQMIRGSWKAIIAEDAVSTVSKTLSQSIKISDKSPAKNARPKACAPRNHEETRCHRAIWFFLSYRV
jgi:hypothetical protein